MPDTKLKDYPDKIDGILTNFSGHETFPCRYGWLKKGFDAVVENPNIFSTDYATITLGVGKNMVKSIRHWCLAFSIIEEYNSPGKKLVRASDIGNAIFDSQNGFDPYLENPATLWLLHWLLSTSVNRATVWFWAFNQFARNEFTRQQIESELEASTRELNWKAFSENSVKRTIDCFFRTYVFSDPKPGKSLEETFNCPLSELQLIYRGDNETTFHFNFGKKRTLPIGLLTALISEFWDAYYPEDETLLFERLAFPNRRSPICLASIFKIDHHSLVDYVEQLEKYTNGYFRYDDTAGIRNIYRNSGKTVNTRELLENFYNKSFFTSNNSTQRIDFRTS